ncbi:MAG: metal ABC transporter permease [Gammaproteobacteria bacterium]|nr:metal ABC transporter permease [Gammaproteobacteria bacterium]
MIDGIPDFILYALAGGIGVALAAGPLGCFVVWRRMAYFGDSLAHSALLGVALGTLLHLNLNLAIALLCAGIAILLMLLSRQQSLASDTLLGIFAHSSLALGMVVLSFMPQVRFDLNGYLFGDLLAVSALDVGVILAGAGGVLALLTLLWRGLLMVTLHEELARVEGFPVARLQLMLMLMLALVIAAAMKIVGILLITALLIIPAASARPLARTPEHMACLAALFGAGAVLGGLGLSLWADTPAGPSVVVVATSGFALSWLLTRGHTA